MLTRSATISIKSCNFEAWSNNMERALYLAIGLSLLMVAAVACGVLARSWVRNRLQELIEWLRLLHDRI